MPAPHPCPCSDLVGGIQSVTLGDEEARRRGVQKSILERAAPPTFDVAIEMLERGKWRVHLDVSQVRWPARREGPCGRHPPLPPSVCYAVLLKGAYASGR